MSKRPYTAIGPTIEHDEERGDAMDIDPYMPDVAPHHVEGDGEGIDGYTTIPRLLCALSTPVFYAFDVATARHMHMTQPFDILPVELLYAGIVPYLGQSHISMLSGTNRYFYCMLAPLLHAECFVTWPRSFPWSSTNHSVRYERRQDVARHQTAMMAVSDGDWALFKKLMFDISGDELPAYAYSSISSTAVMDLKKDGSIILHSDKKWNYPISALLYNTPNSTVTWGKRLKAIAASFGNKGSIIHSKTMTHASLLFMRVLTYALGYDSIAYMDMVQTCLSDVSYSMRRDGNLAQDTWRDLVYWPYAWSQGSRALIQDEIERHGLAHMNFNRLSILVTLKETYNTMQTNGPQDMAAKMTLGATIPVSTHASMVLDRFIESAQNQWIFDGKLFPWLAGLVGYKVQREWGAWSMNDMFRPVEKCYVEWLCRAPQAGGNTFLPLALAFRNHAPIGHYYEDRLFDDEKHLGMRIGRFVGAGLNEVARRFVYEFVVMRHDVLTEGGHTERERNLFVGRMWDTLSRTALHDIIGNLASKNADFIGTLYRTLGQVHAMIAARATEVQAMINDIHADHYVYHEIRVDMQRILAVIWKRFTMITSYMEEVPLERRSGIVDTECSLLVASLAQFPALEPIWFDVLMDLGLSNILLPTLRHLVHWTYASGTRNKLFSTTRLVTWFANPRVIEHFATNKERPSTSLERIPYIADTCQVWFRDFVELVHISCSHLDAKESEMRRADIFDAIVHAALRHEGTKGFSNIVMPVMEEALAKGVFKSTRTMVKRDATKITTMMRDLTKRVWDNKVSHLDTNEIKTMLASLSSNCFELPKMVFDSEYTNWLHSMYTVAYGSSTVGLNIVHTLRLYTESSVQIQIAVPLLVFSRYYDTVCSFIVHEAWPHLFGKRSGASHDMFECLMHTVATLRTSSIKNAMSIVQHARARMWPENMTISSRHAKYPRSVYKLIQSLRARGFPSEMTSIVMSAIEDIDLANMQARGLVHLLDMLINPPSDGKMRKKGDDYGAGEGEHEEVDSDAEDKQPDIQEPVANTHEERANECLRRMRVVYYVMDRIGRVNNGAKLAKCLTRANTERLLERLLNESRFGDTTASHLHWAVTPTSTVRLSHSCKIMVTMLTTHGYVTFEQFQEAASAFSVAYPCILTPANVSTITAKDLVMPSTPYTTNDLPQGVSV